MLYILNLFSVIVYYAIIHFLPLRKTKKEYLFALIVTIHAILFRALADPYNYKDTANYARAFNYISGFSFREAALTVNDFTGWGQGYVVLNWVLSRFTYDPAILFIVLSILSVGLVMWFYSRTSDMLLLTVILYAIYPMLYLMGFAVIRQHLSIAFMLIALYYSNDLKKSIPLAVCSGFMHYAGFLFIPFYFWRRLELRKLNSLKLLFFIGTGMLVLRVSFGNFLTVLADVGVSRYDGFGQESEGSNIIPVLLLGLLVSLFFHVGVFSKCKEKDADIVKFVTYGLMISLFCIGLSGGGRLTLPFIYVIPVAIALPFKYARKNFNINILITLFIILLFLRQLTLMMKNFVLTYDYTFFWE